MTAHNPTLGEEVKRGFRRACGELLNRAYQAAKSAGDFQSSWDEDEFTRDLVKYMDKINEEDFHYPFRVTWDEKGKTENNIQTASHPNRAQRVDITLDRVRCSGTTEYSIECKRISSDKASLARKYWKKGVRRFVDAEYADKYSFGGMAGYVLSGSVEANAKELEKRCENYNGRLRVKNSWELKYREKGMSVYVTEHRRDQVNDIELDHHLLDFT